MPYKDPEEQRRAMKRIMRKRRTKLKRIKDALMNLEKPTFADVFDGLQLGQKMDWIVCYVEDTKTKVNSRKVLVPTDVGITWGDQLQSSGSPLRLKGTRRFIAFSIPFNWKKGSELDRKILEVFDKIAELKEFAPAERYNSLSAGG